MKRVKFENLCKMSDEIQMIMEKKKFDKKELSRFLKVECEKRDYKVIKNFKKSNSCLFSIAIIILHYVYKGESIILELSESIKILIYKGCEFHDDIMPVIMNINRNELKFNEL